MNFQHCCIACSHTVSIAHLDFFLFLPRYVRYVLPVSCLATPTSFGILCQVRLSMYYAGSTRVPYHSSTLFCTRPNTRRNKLSQLNVRQCVMLNMCTRVCLCACVRVCVCGGKGGGDMLTFSVSLGTKVKRHSGGLRKRRLYLVCF